MSERIDETRVVVLESVRGPGPTIKYVDQVVRYAPQNVKFKYFSFSRAIFGRYDVFHVHWPEFLVRGTRRPVRWARRVLMLVTLARLRSQRPKIVRTLHNIEPHAPGDRIEQILLTQLDKLVTDYVAINAVTEFPDKGSHHTVLHGDYRETFGAYRGRPARIRHAVYAGRIEPYKGVIELCRIFCADPSLDATLQIVGSASTSDSELIRNIAADDPRVELNLKFVSDAELAEAITDASLVVLPYREMHNSGIALLALSLDRPILVPRSAANEALAREVGTDWVMTFDGDVSAATLSTALSQASSLRGTAPSMTARDWRSVAKDYARVFTAGSFR